MKKRLLNWLLRNVPTEKTGMINFKHDAKSFMEAIGIDDETTEKLESILSDRTQEWVDNDEFDHVDRLHADFQAECIVRGITLTPSIFIFIGAAGEGAMIKKKELKIHRIVSKIFKF